MTTNMFLAIKNITGNKKKSVFIILIIAVVLAMTLMVTIIKENLISYNIQAITTDKGSWHYIVPITRYEAIDSIRRLDGVSEIAVVRRSLILEDELEAYDCVLVEAGEIGLLVNENISGNLPKHKGEVLVPDWYVKKYSINELPHNLSVCGLELKITGTYITGANGSFAQKVKMYFCSGDMTEIFNPNTFETSPFDNIITDSSHTQFCYVRLHLDADPNEVISQIGEIEGVSSFQTSNNPNASFSEGIIKNDALLETENLISTANYSGGFVSKNISQIITGILLLVLFIAIFVAINLIISGDIKLCGILQALGLSQSDLRNIFILQSVFLSIASIPIGAGLGIGGAYLLLQNSLAKVYGGYVIPWVDVIACVVACTVFVLLATIYPSVQASRTTCIEAIYGTQNNDHQEYTVPDHPSLTNCKGKFSFVLRYSVRNVLQNPKRALSFALVIALILSLFVKLSAEIEKSWKEGSWRQSYTSDYVIGYDWNIRPESKFIDPAVIDTISQTEGVESVYYQHSVFDSDMSLPGVYNYYFKLSKNVVTEQGYKQLSLSSPITRNGYDDTVFVSAGISGYREQELEQALSHLIEGDVTVEQMKTENIILLPKYILWLENMDVPYTDLQVGDQVTIVENQARSLRDVDIVNEYTFTIGGFVDTLPFPQTNGVSNGFVAIMYWDKVQKFGTPYKGISQVYIDQTENVDIAFALETLCAKNQLGFTNNANDFRQQEREEKANLLTFSFYAIFAVLCAVIFLSVFNILLSNLILRTREFSLLYIVGVTKWQRNTAILIEILSFTIPGILCGIIGGVLLIVLGDRSSEILNIAQLIPITHIALSSAVVLSAVGFATILGVFLINRRINVNME